jgi:hypothetical protein
MKYILTSVVSFAGGLFVYWFFSAPLAPYNPCTDTIRQVIPNHTKTAAVFVVVRDCGATTRANTYMVMSTSEKGLQVRNDELVYTDTGLPLQDRDQNQIYVGPYETVAWTSKSSLRITGTTTRNPRMVEWNGIRIEYQESADSHPENWQRP